jgi:hypothetical protein
MYARTISVTLAHLGKSGPGGRGGAKIAETALSKVRSLSHSMHNIYVCAHHLRHIGLLGEIRARRAGGGAKIAAELWLSH